jgi:PAS domain S-box-containing protein
LTIKSTIIKLLRINNRSIDVRFGQRLRELRKARGMTQRELADKVGINFTYLSKLETGVMPRPGEKIILALAKVLDADPDELFGLAKKIPSDIIEQLNAEMVKGLRYLQDGEEPLIGGLASLRRRIAEPAASETLRSHMAEAPGEGEEFFRALVEDSLDGIVILNSDLRVIYENPSAAQILGYKSGELAVRDALNFIHPDDIARIAHSLTQLAQNPGETSRNVVRIRHKDGMWCVVEGVGYSLLHDSRVKGILITYRDISEREPEAESRTERVVLAMAKEYHLTESERKVLMLMTEGQSNPEIAERMVISPSTVRFHISNILGKLGVTNRTKAVALAVRRHLVT